jgi:hypothetical protein
MMYEVTVIPSLSRKLPTNATPLPSALAPAGAKARHSDQASAASAWRNLPTGALAGRCLDFARSLRSRAPLDMPGAAAGGGVAAGGGTAAACRPLSQKRSRHSDQARVAGAWRNLPTNATPLPSAEGGQQMSRQARHDGTDATPSPSALAPAGAPVSRCLDFARSLRSRAPLDMTAAAAWGGEAGGGGGPPPPPPRPLSPKKAPSFRPERPQGGEWRNLPTNATPFTSAEGGQQVPRQARNDGSDATPSPNALAAAGAHVGRCLGFARSRRARAPLDMTAAAVRGGEAGDGGGAACLINH